MATIGFLMGLLLACRPDEVCNGIDDDRDDSIDEDAIDALTWFADQDADGFGNPDAPRQSCEAPLGFVGDSTDCDDAALTTFPLAPELCNDIDDDCDGTSSDENEDQDGDGYTACDSDCDDGDFDVSPDGIETCDGRDEDCDGYANNGFEDDFEPNDGMEDAPAVLGDDAAITIAGTFTSTDDHADWYRIETDNDTEFLVNTFAVAVTLDDVPDGVSTALRLYYYGDEVASDTDPTDGLSLNWLADSFGLGGGGTFYVLVEHTGGFDCDAPYELTLENHG
jgi:hypothetical protein